MKKVLFTVAFVVVAGSAFAGNFLTGSKHDLSSGSANPAKGTSGELCRYCHTPHNPIQVVPLWNRAAGITTAIALYENEASLDETAVTLAADSTSRMCLSCHDSAINAQGHDGTIALGAIPGASVRINEAGTSLTNDHPVGFGYGTTLVAADGNLKTPNGKNQVDAAGKVRLWGGADAAAGGTLECGSCHAVHGADNGSGSVIPKLLVMANTGSALCITCHNK